ncbi:hypothetical protein FAUST_2326 [Fusarium austroamericanum]|uniref:Ysc84 actin-binding domain-containing protein n=1 Tax=Fusarium austroamericanum TaxID=282268 RepID=A0AAN6C6X7_FUSAU|nr:hypothetical protein FAUST_2326 [Fusarium austroamericanum]
MTARKKKLSISSIGGNKKENMKGNGRSNEGGSRWSFGRWGSTRTASTNTLSNLHQPKPKSKSKSRSRSKRRPNSRTIILQHPRRSRTVPVSVPGTRTLLSFPSPPSSARQNKLSAFSCFNCRSQVRLEQASRHCRSSFRLQFCLFRIFIHVHNFRVFFYYNYNYYANFLLRLAYYNRYYHPGLVSFLVYHLANFEIDANIHYSCICIDSKIRFQEDRPLSFRHYKHLYQYKYQYQINTTAANASGRVQKEAFWPATLDLECEKAARILKSFSTDGYLVPADEEEDSYSTISEPRSPKRVTKKIPQRVIQNAAGIAIFTCMRSGLYMTGSGGSGILIARKSDGTWSPPSGIMLHTPTLSFIIGVDVYDCVLVVNNLAALESITKPRVTLGEDVGLVSGPLVSLDSDESHIKWQDMGNTVLTYLKSRGQNQAVNLNGCILAERGNENERFYASQVTQMDILAGNVARDVEEVGPLSEVIKMAEGRTDYDASVINKIAAECAPGDAMIATPKSSTPASPRTAFGIPNQDDPDPFGVLALEMAGLEIREAGSRLRPTSSQFDFNPAPSSPAFSKFNRQSIETFVSKSNRNSYMSSRTVKSQMTDAGTQTDVGTTPETSPSPGQSEDGHDRSIRLQIPEVTEEEEEVDYTKVDLTPIRHFSGAQSPLSTTSHSSTMAVEPDTLKVEPRDDTDKASSNYDSDKDDKSSRNADDEGDSESDAGEEDEEEPVVFEVAAVQPARTQAVASRMVHAKGNMVIIPKRVPPPLPMRNPGRASRSSKSEMGDVSSLRSPLRKEAFTEADLASDNEHTDSESSPYLKPKEFKVEKTKIETKSDDDKSSESEVEFFLAEEVKTEGAKAEVTKVEDTKAEETKEEAPGTELKIELKDAQTSPRIPQEERPDSPSTPDKKHTSSVYTGVTEDRWSVDGTTLTTPTSDRPFSVIDDITEDETPRKPAKEAEPTEMNEKHEELEKMASKETTSNTITVV